MGYPSDEQFEEARRDRRPPAVRKQHREEALRQEDPSAWIRMRINSECYENKVTLLSGDVSKEARNNARTKYRDEGRRLKKEFQKDLERAFFDVDDVKTANLHDRDKLDLLFRLAWENGHGAGYEEVLINYEEMVPLLK